MLEDRQTRRHFQWGDRGCHGDPQPQQQEDDEPARRYHAEHASKPTCPEQGDRGREQYRGVNAGPAHESREKRPEWLMMSAVPAREEVASEQIERQLHQRVAEYRDCQGGDLAVETRGGSRSEPGR